MSFLATVVHSGQVSMPKGVILPGEKEIMQGHKVHLSTHGACGVACWRVDCSRSVLAVMWSIPLHFSFWTNWMAIGIFPDTMEITKEMFDLMYRGEQGKIVVASVASKKKFKKISKKFQYYKFRIFSNCGSQWTD